MATQICKRISMHNSNKTYFINLANTSKGIFLILISIWSKTVAFNLDIRYPIVFEDPSKDLGRKSYFGYSVLLYSELGRNNSWIQVGAPRENSTLPQDGAIVEPGVVYRCQLSPLGHCKPLNITGNGNQETGSNNILNERKDGAWMGAAMDVQPGPYGRTVVCSHRWINEFAENYYMVGSCYWSSAEDDGNRAFNRMVPLADIDRYEHTTNVGAVFDFGVGEAGMSVHMPLELPIEKPSKLVMGAPGILNSKGGIILYEDSDYADDGSEIIGFSKVWRPNKEATLIFGDSDYTGYQVNSGYFFKKDVLLYVASAPRAEKLKGKVMLLYLSLKGKHRRRTFDYRVINKVYGSQCGEYFGASIAVGDLNDDGYDDLIVGAPFFSNHDATGPDYDRGRIAVFLSSHPKLLKEQQQIIGYEAGGRFGSAISFLGDINSDTFPEVAVGAPYEDDGRGAVYIYSSNSNGDLGQPIQRLAARDCYDHLRGFGSSISLHRIDIDGNGCPDIAVGAYGSGHAIIYRGQPVVRWTVQNPQPHPTSILHNATHFTLQSACVTYLGRNAPNTLEVQRTVELDVEYRRCQEPTIKKVITLSRGESTCENLEIPLKPKISNVLNPIEVKITYELIKKESRTEDKTHRILVKRDGIEGIDYFCKECPITQELPMSELTIPFSIECGLDSVCNADLSVQGELPELKNRLGEGILPFVTGSSNTLTFNVLVANSKTSDKAYFSHVYIKIGAPASLSRFLTECQEVLSLPFLNNSTEEELNNSTDSSGGRNVPSIYLSCDIGHIPPGKERELSIELDMRNTQGFNVMELAAWATTFNQETNPSDNWWSDYVELHNEADITIAGKGVPEINPLVLGSKNESETKINFNHYYEVQKFGYSRVDKVSIELQVPMYIIDKKSKNSSPFLILKEYKGYQGGQPLSCSSDDTVDSDDGMPSKLPQSHSIKKRFAIEDISNSNEVPTNRTVYINCSSPAITATHLIECITVNCVSGPFLNSRTEAKVSLNMEIDTQSLGFLMDPRHIILLRTQGFVKVIEPHGLKQPANEKADLASAYTIFIGDAPKKKLESWVLALAIAAGIMIVLFLVMALGKAGFFKRKKKHELKALKRQTLMEISEDVLKALQAEEQEEE